MENTNNRNILIGGVILLVFIAGAVWYFSNRTPNDIQHLVIPGSAEQIINDTARIEFTYYGSIDGYFLLQSLDDAVVGDSGLVKAYTLVNTKAYNENDSRVEGIGTKIPSINILVFNQVPNAITTAPTDSTATTTPDAPAGPSLSEWAEAHSGFTAYGLKTEEPEDAEVDGIHAIRYHSEGPFASETYIVNYRGRYYVFLGQYASEEDAIRTAFKKLLSDVFFL